jgi:hypothetical protein
MESVRVAKKELSEEQKIETGNWKVENSGEVEGGVPWDGKECVNCSKE